MGGVVDSMLDLFACTVDCGSAMCLACGTEDGSGAWEGEGLGRPVTDLGCSVVSHLLPGWLLPAPAITGNAEHGRMGAL